ncbi:hypothetical protein COEREDRAFT_89911 [Coemansia reversa NRRL 1564]|uniref:lytic cellulose monooxygenase (C4-dehydrogenating) n=1 Tax=Coemansia reversa (strain ATCC 12441 / NRRL 1564) TaxID=763665 RepID=A0A2G5B1Y2_COERN|nr:hypothetical protein COEREDRAFT_89911 [Coemansia reversa NRRL 1564]|eukprot:PIA13019.1 hypothetical protein COEREDRAFT_89911 [Coemansia reversa NRRL 1564]
MSSTSTDICDVKAGSTITLEFHEEEDQSSRAIEDGKLDVVIPADIADGEYILRREIIALHLAEKIGGAEFYPNCAQINVVGGGVSIPKGVAIPGVYKEDDPGIHFNLYDGYDSYSIPGPQVYKSGGSLPADDKVNTDSSTTNIVDDNSETTQIVYHSKRPSHRCKRKRRKRRNINHAFEL